MNKRLVIRTIGSILKIEAFLMLLPLIVSFIYKDGDYLSFIVTALIYALMGYGLKLIIKKDKTGMSQKDAFAIVGISWILISIIGSLPYIISGSIPSFVDALFETISGFTTTGATILSGSRIESLSKSVMFYRNFTHFMGGIGVLVFVLAISTSDGKALNLLKAESTGPQVGKLVSKVSTTAKILCLIYLALTTIETIMLVLDPNLDLFDSICIAFSTAGTGGFANYAASLANISTYAQMVTASFMVVFGINFNIFFMILAGKVLKAIRNEEFITYISIIILSIITITANLLISVSEVYNTFGHAFKDAFFQTATFISSTGFTNTFFDNWPTLSRGILLLISYIGSCSGSTGGGIKVSRIVILFKAFRSEIRKILHPRNVESVKLDKEAVDEATVRGTVTYTGFIIAIAVICTLLVSLNGYSLHETFFVVSSCLNNTGAGLGDIINIDGFGVLSPFSKIVLSFAMLIGRLEIYPILILFTPKIWIKK